MSARLTKCQWLDFYRQPENFYLIFPDYANLQRAEKSEVGLSTSQSNQKDAIEIIIEERMNL